ncbi:phosphatidylinositol-binding protein scs2 [Ceratobasidium sp. UAMH 11750]|nr:phosphatidylinositol-binding protein scs2 [Ceratobasidium sp. UAMH 11750]
MSLQLSPSGELGFHRPFTQVVTRSITLTNQNAQWVAFKVKTTSPKLYVVRPNFGVIEPGSSANIQVLLQALREDPPLSFKCKDKFLVQSMILTPDRLSKPVQELWVFDEGEDIPQIHQQKFKVAYLPPESQPIEKEYISEGTMFTAEEPVHSSPNRGESSEGNPGQARIAAGAMHFLNSGHNVSIHGAPSPVPSPNPSLRASIIGGATPLPDVVLLLVEHGCQDITGTLDPSACGEYPISSGGFGDVYKGKLRDGSPIAIKCMRIVVNPDSPEDQKHLKCAAREIHTWSKLHHRYTSRLLGLALFRGQIAMVSPWAERGSLPIYLAKKPELNKLLLCARIAEGLAFLHASGVIHGDLKGANVLVSDTDEPLLADFGNAVLYEQTLKFTYTTAKKNLSPRWTAPELLDEGSYSVEADVYALGMVSTHMIVLIQAARFHDFLVLLCRLSWK